MAIETNELIDVKTLSPFKKFIMTIGNLPTSYLESMTYAEMLMWFCNYLQETVIPTVNNNGGAVEELQNLFIELKQYCEDYLTDENLQPLINNKLDEMAEDGTLADIINQEIFSEIQANQLTEMVIIGDSYSADYYTSQQNIIPWHYYVSKQYHLNRHNYAEGGNGFVAGSDGNVTYNNTFNNQINTAYADTSFDNNKVGLLVIYGGLNDILHDGNISDTYGSALGTFNNARAKFPNARIIFVGGNTLASYPADRTYNNQTYHYYDLVSNYMQAACHAGIESYCDSYMYIFDQYMFSSGFGGHPGNYGHEVIANFMLSGGNYNGRTKQLSFSNSGLKLDYLGDHEFLVSGTSTTS